LRRINWLKVAKVTASAIWSVVTGIPNPAALAGIAGVMQSANKCYKKIILK
jgi:hypothetical protein